MSDLKEFSVVALLEPVSPMKRGDVGAVVDISRHGTIEVEFVTDDGDTEALLTLRPNQVLVLRNFHLAKAS